MLKVNLQFFGGRGSKSSLTPRSGAQDTSQWGGNVGDQVADTLKEAVGTKGAPKSMGDAIIETNPNHSRDYKEFSHNCQRVVVAYELRRRGYDVEALPTFKGDVLPRIAYANPKNQTFSGRWRGAFQNSKVESVGARGNNPAAEQKVMSNIADKMHQYGNGARAVIQIFYRNGGGHVFNVENQNGRVVYVEAQSGKIKNMAETMKNVDTNTVNIVRVDNLKLSDRARNFVKKKK